MFGSTFRYGAVVLAVIPLLILLLIALSHVIDEGRLLATLSEYLEFVVPGQAAAIVDERRRPENRDLFQVVETVEEVFGAIAAPQPITPPAGDESV